MTNLFGAMVRVSQSRGWRVMLVVVQLVLAALMSERGIQFYYQGF